MKNPISGNRPCAVVFAAITLALTLIGAVLRIINLYTNFEIDVGYYSYSPLVDVMHVFFLASVVALGILTLVMLKRIALERIDSEKDPTVGVVLCFLAVAALVYIVAKSYFDVYFAMNSSNKILLHMAAIAAMFFFVTLARLCLGALKPRSYLFFLAATVFMSGVYAIPSVFFCIISRIYREYTYFAFDIAILAAFVFAAVKLIALITAKKPQPLPEEAEAIDVMSETTDESDESIENIPADTTKEE